MDGQSRTITRMRPSLACVPCKRKKVKCDKQKPECGGCQRTNTSCVYETMTTPNSGIQTFAKRQKTGPESRIEEHPSGHMDVSIDGPSNMQRQREQPTPSLLLLSPLSQSLQWANLPDATGIGTTPRQFDNAMTLLDTNAHTFAPHLTTVEGFNSPGDLMLYNSKDRDNLNDVLQTDHRSIELDHTIVGQQSSGSVSGASMTTTTDSSIVASEQYYYDSPKKNRHHNQRRASPQRSRSHPGNQGSRGSSTPCTGVSAGNSSAASHEDFDRAVHSVVIEDWKAKPWRYTREGAGSLRLDGYPSDGKRHQDCYFTAPFWLWSSGQDAEATVLMDRHFSAYQNESFEHRRQSRFAGVLVSLPSKKLCHVLLRAFLLGVRPLLPLLSESNLKERYSTYWAQRDTLGDSRDNKVNHNELSFVCLLWSVLFAGAVSASPTTLSESSFRVTDRAAFIKSLGSKARLAVEACCGRDLQFPTLDGLVASLILYHCDCTIDQMVETPSFLARCFQAARRLGLHREAALTAMSASDAETGRRVWHTLLDMEVMASIRCGLSLSYDSIDNSFDTREPISGEYEETIDGLGGLASTISAAAQRRMTRVLRRIFGRCDGDDRSWWRQPDYDGQVEEIEQFDSFIDESVAQLAARDLPERGQISSQLLTANPLTHGNLYLDNAREANVLNAFCRIRLTMMKYTVSIAFNRMFLDKTPQEGEAARLWGFQMTNCVQFLRNYLHLAGLPAFTPYRWYCLAQLDVWQEPMIVLSFLRNNPWTGRSRQPLLHILGDVFDMFDMLAGWVITGVQGKGTFGEPSCPRAAMWVGMRRLYEQVQSGVQYANECEKVERFGAEPHSSRSWPSSDSDAQTRAFDVDGAVDTRTKKRMTDRTRSATELLQIPDAAEITSQPNLMHVGDSLWGLETLTPDSGAFHGRSNYS